MPDASLATTPHQFLDATREKKKEEKKRNKQAEAWSLTVSWKGLVAAERTQLEPANSGWQSKHHCPPPQSTAVEHESPT